MNATEDNLDLDAHSRNALAKNPHGREAIAVLDKLRDRLKDQDRLFTMLRQAQFVIVRHGIDGAHHEIRAVMETYTEVAGAQIGQTTR